MTPDVTIRPITPDDGERLRGAFERLSADSRRRRFLAPKERLTDAEVRYLTDVDHHDHEALVATAPAPDAGDVVGVARYVRIPEQPDTAEAAVAVIDEWQRRGVGTALLEQLADRARSEGVRAFCAEVLPENRHRIEDVFGAVGQLSNRDGAETVRLQFDLPPSGLGGQLLAGLRAAASGAMSLVRPLYLPSLHARDGTLAALRAMRDPSGVRPGTDPDSG